MIALTYTTHGTVQQPFVQGMMGLLFSGLPITQCLSVSHALVTQARNDLARQFLTTDCEWMLSLDADVVASPDAILALLAAEGEIRAGWYPVRIGDKWLPSWFTKHSDEAQFVPVEDATKDMTLSGCGMGFVLIHRAVFERMQSDDPWCWFGHDLVGGQRLGEDLTFFHRANLPITGVASARAVHHKTMGI